MTTLDTILLWWRKAYLWLALGAIGLVLLLLVLRRKQPGAVTPKEIVALENAATQVRTAMAKAQNDADIKTIKAEARNEAVDEQVNRILAMSDELEKAKALVELKKAL